jgi:hypothetical protein
VDRGLRDPLCLDFREQSPFDLADHVQHFIKVLQAITTFADFLIAHHSLSVAPHDSGRRYSVCASVGSYYNTV